MKRKIDPSYSCLDRDLFRRAPYGALLVYLSLFVFALAPTDRSWYVSYRLTRMHHEGAHHLRWGLFVVHFLFSDHDWQIQPCNQICNSKIREKVRI